MKTPVWCELVCAQCASAYHGRWVFSSRLPVRDMIAAGKSNGWKFKHDEAFCSQDCLTEYEGDQNDKS